MGQMESIAGGFWDVAVLQWECKAHKGEFSFRLSGYLDTYFVGKILIWIDIYT